MKSRGRMGSEKPNIILIMSDDQGSWALGCAGNSEVRTPRLDELAGEGIRFENFFCTSPVCSPARASVLTGRIPSAHGVHDWIAGGSTFLKKYESSAGRRLIQYLRGTAGYTDFLSKAGYFCGMSGKWHLGDNHHPQKSFEFWKVFARSGFSYYDTDMIDGNRLYAEPGYVTEAVTENALEFLRQAEGKNRPFYLSVCYTAPHAPWGREHHPAKLYDSYYYDCQFNSAPGDSSLPEWVKFRAIPVDDEKTRREYLSGYYAAITAMDAGIGRVIDYLESSGLRDDTLIVFISDNGMNMGHHGVYGKGNATFPLNMFEESVKVPCIISHRGKAARGAVNSSLLSQYDIFPTILEYAGLDNPDGKKLPGKSFAGLLRGESSGGRECVVVFSEYGPVRMVRTESWKYVHRYPYGPHELYCLEDDPREEYNLSGCSGYEKKLLELRGLLSDWFLEYVDSGMDGALEGVSGGGQSGMCGIRSEGRNSFSDAPLRSVE